MPARTQVGSLVCASLLLLVVGQAAVAQEKGVEPAKAQAPSAASAAPADPAPPAKLEVGQPAPALVIEHWVKGEPVKSFEKGKFYVVEFWATWCGPCIQGMPHLTKLQKEYKDKGLTIIGVSGQDKRGVEDVRPFVEKKGDKMGYTVAVDKGMATVAAYMGATGRNAIPCAFVVDKEGKLAWFGHPMEGMDLVIEGIAAGTFDATKHAANMAKFREMSEAFGKATQSKDWDAALKALDEMKTVRPDLATDFAVSRFAVLRVGKKDKEAAAAARVQLISDMKDDTDKLRKLSQMLAGVPEPDDADKAAAVSLAQTVVDKTGGKDALDLAVLATTFKNQGDWDKAIATMKRAIAAAEDDGQKRSLEGMLNQMESDRAGAAKPDAPKVDAPPSK